MLERINNQYGSYRGLIRLTLDRIKHGLGQYRALEEVNWSEVTRLVFVCQGNICRSPYAHVVAARETSLRIASIGYATTTGLPADGVARKVALERGVSLNEHLTTDIRDFTFLQGDLALVMEDRHVPKVESNVRKANAQVTMLGLWARPIYPLIYDPKSLSPEYFHECYRVIESAVATVIDRMSKGEQSSV